MTLCSLVAPVFVPDVVVRAFALYFNVGGIHAAVAVDGDVVRIRCCDDVGSLHAEDLHFRNDICLFHFRIEPTP